jgi:hypothetical protein
MTRQPEAGRKAVNLTQNAQTADVRGPEPRPSVELPILPDIARVGPGTTTA